MGKCNLCKREAPYILHWEDDTFVMLCPLHYDEHRQGKLKDYGEKRLLG